MMNSDEAMKSALYDQSKKRVVRYDDFEAGWNAALEWAATQNPAPAQPVRLSEDEIDSLWDAHTEASAKVTGKRGYNAIRFYDECWDAMLAKGAAQPAVVQQLYEAANAYYLGYCQDEAYDLDGEDTGCSREQHRKAAALRDALQAWEQTK